MSTHPKPSDWAKYDDLLSAGTRGWNPLVRLPQILKDAYPWMREFEFGFCSQSDIPHWRSQGWSFLETSHFDIDNFNDVAGLRFGVSDAAGHVRYRDNFIMIQPKDYRDKLRRRRNEESEAMFDAQMTGQKYIAPGDEGGSSESSFEEVVVGPGESESNAKPRRGRPPKK